MINSLPWPISSFCHSRADRPIDLQRDCSAVQLASTKDEYILIRILYGKSSDLRFGKPAGSNYQDMRALISGGRVLT
jgi:hypothetical protein